jgi:cytochrome c-type biogenesis protein CcmI
MTWPLAAGLLLALLALAFVLYPLLRPPSITADEQAADSSERREAIYRQVLDIELEQQMGKIDEAEARELKAGLMRQAEALVSVERGA